jgi:hypothetical protein
MEGFTMTYEDKAKLFAKELTMEHIRERQTLIKSGESDSVNKVADIMENYYQAISSNPKLKNLL